MSTAPPDRVERVKQYWKWNFAMTSLADAKRIAELLESTKPGENTPIRLALETALHVIYARAFNKSHGVGPLKEVDDFVPIESMALHNQVINHRNESYAHVDAQAELDDNKIHQLRGNWDGSNWQVHPTKRTFDMDDLPMIIALCERVRVSVLAAMLRWHRENWGRLPEHSSTLEYGLNFDSTADGDWVPIDPLPASKSGQPHFARESNGDLDEEKR